MLNQVVAVLLGTVLLLPLAAKAGVLNMFRSKPYPEVFFSGDLLTVAQAIKKKDIEKAKQLAEKLSDIDAPGTENFTLLAFAVADTNIPAIKMLMALGADPSAKLGSRGQNGSVAYLAMWRKTTDALKAMLESGMDPNLSDKGDSLIFNVPELAGNDSLKLLVEYGADVNAKDTLGQTPMFNFVLTSFDEAIYLLDNGADPFVMDKAGVTLAYSVQNRIENMSSELEAYQKLLTIQQKMIELGVKFPALTPYGERFRNDIVYCKEPRGYRPRSECKVEGVNRFPKSLSEESKLADEKILRERYGIDVHL
ncbi:ankyrin repeat domain-containing protein [Vibrio vulnificus]|uniref:ankyrin repeat domain-containing protein n=1 Tax=Vibrio vulnificus TaxID=672 RepID=UPI00102993FA|nr:ankyrin repeat domain-containing protein [Vibrio vulnificus]RZP74420.1 ankyrin repeat domain-containing protein [Vibrio vulnificus]RZP76125.1 ankyrin repeat domain-containing protein [Vibrio vulnificus]